MSDMVRDLKGLPNTISSSDPGRRSDSLIPFPGQRLRLNSSVHVERFGCREEGGPGFKPKAA